MEKLLSEKEVKKLLGVSDFRHMTKENIITFASKMSEMDPTVAVKAIEQFPEFSKQISEIVKDYSKQVDKTIKSAEDSLKAVYENDRIILKSLAALLEKGEALTFEERKFIVSEMETIAERDAYKDSEHKKFLVGLASIAGAVVFTAAGVCVSALTGGKFELRLPFKNE